MLSKDFKEFIDLLNEHKVRYLVMLSPFMDIHAIQKTLMCG